MMKLPLLAACALSLTPGPPRRCAVRRRAFSDDDLLSAPAPAGRPPASKAQAGHGYARGPGEDDGFVDIAAVDMLLTRRNEAKRQRDFVVADALRDELKVEHNVGCHDRDRTWWLGRQKREKRERAPLPTDHGYTREIDDKTHLMDERAVDALLLARVHAKMTRDFDKADQLRAQLSAAHGVRVHDARKVWRGGVSSDTADPWSREEDKYQRDTRDGGGGVDDGAVQAMIRRRAVARRRRHWDLADDILEQLLSLGVVVNDKTKLYSATVDYVPCEAQCRGTLAPADREHIAALVAERSLLKLRRRFDEADAIRDRLLEGFGVRIDDKKHTWWQLVAP